MVTKFDDLMIWWYIYIYNIPFLTWMTQNWTKNITTKTKMTKHFKKIYTKDTINGYVYVERIS